jgi:hypothetical protein
LVNFQGATRRFIGKADKPTKSQHRKLTKLPRPRGSQKMNHFCVTAHQHSAQGCASSQSLEMISFFDF